MTSEQMWGLIMLVAGGVLTGIFGTGGFVAWQRARNDRKLGIQAQESAEDDALAGRWKSLIEAQTKSLLEPLEKRVGDLSAEVERLKNDLAAEQAKRRETETRYWKAIAYIRVLIAYIRGHNPHSTYPDPPAIIAEDI